jgi:ORF6N domain
VEILKYEQVERKIIEVRHRKVILDSDVAELYGVETKRINEAVKNNSDKFPEGYLIELTEHEKNELVENFDRFNKLKHSTANPKGFTEQGLYMLATILKSPKATETTLAIIDTFTKVREIGRTIQELPTIPENSPKHHEIVKKAGDLISELIMPDDMEIAETESSIEVNLAVVKFKYTIKKKGK